MTAMSKAFDVSLANFWPATPQQPYRELERLTQDGLIEARVVLQERRPHSGCSPSPRPADAS